MDPENVRDIIVEIPGLKRHKVGRLHIPSDTQKCLAIHDGDVVFELSAFRLDDLLNLRALPLGNADIRECFIEGRSDLRGRVSRNPHYDGVDTLYLKIVPSQGRGVLWGGKLRRDDLLAALDER